ncbi:unnamed protein product [Clonostachys byssicola]|uniref:Uncharacterized protein n=1 Tax=Clonostachys byssicola TaxID=160290 RepID=A0A9N9UPG4_9HYPO|nr:unnamed protein product [Clonostachys byssicola]
MAEDKKKLAATYMGLMADLGRHRQEELPLSNEQRKGPSYDPYGSRTHYNKVSVKKAKEASTAWSNCIIKDEETEQMEGLEMSECPWRPNNPPPGIPTRHHGLAPDKPRKASAPKRPLQDNTISFAPVNKEVQKKPEPEKKPQPVEKTTQPVEKTTQPVEKTTQPVEKTTQPVEKASAKRDDSINRDQDPTASNDKLPGEVSLANCVFQNGPLFNGEDEPVAYFGTFMNYPGSGGPESRFPVEFEIKVKVSPPSACLHLRARGGTREHDISLLDTPQTESQFCILTTKGGPNARYFLEFADPAATKLFSACVHNTQKWLAHTQENVIPKEESTTSPAKQKEVSPKAEPDRGEALSAEEPKVLPTAKSDTGKALSTGKPEVLPTAKSNRDEVEAKNNHQHVVSKDDHPEQPTNNAENEPEALPKADQETAQITNGVAEQKEALHSSEKEACLINITESLASDTLEKKVSNSTARKVTGKAFDGLWDAAGALFSTMVSAGEDQRKQLHEEIEEALDVKWRENKIPETYGKVKDAFLTNLHLFIDMRFDHIKQVLQMANRSTSEKVPESMKEFLKPISYKPEDLEHLRPKTTDCPEDIKRAKFLPEKGAAKALPSPGGGRYFANREAPDPATVSKLWSTAHSLTENKVSTPGAAATAANVQSAGQHASQTPDAPPASSPVVSPPQATRTKLPLRGLGSSMYASG